ncbi:hypothetical protein P8452_24046 [Trifolium repens]|jgi:hypothetical protein|nr:hypothetical protein P8452_24046 [Trifolium repens]
MDETIMINVIAKGGGFFTLSAALGLRIGSEHNDANLVGFPTCGEVLRALGVFHKERLKPTSGVRMHQILELYQTLLDTFKVISLGDLPRPSNVTRYAIKASFHSF